MNAKLKLIGILFLAGVFSVSSCKKDETEPTVAKPQITLSEVGLENSKIGYISSDLHLEADIVAEGKINTVKVEIYPEGSGTWEFDTTYTEFSGLKNTIFHKHIDIPLTADTGNYHLHFIVIDMLGNETVAESELKIMQPTDTVAPIITVTLSPTENQSFVDGQTITITGNLTDDQALGGVYIALVRADQNLTDAEINSTNTITLLHNQNFISPTSYSFTASINVGATMDNNNPPKPATWTPDNYYILVKCKDAFGGNWTFSNHYNIVLN
jgi:hypothetical protein